MTEDQLLTVHHEMGHIVYFQNYRHQPRLFRGGANPGIEQRIKKNTIDKKEELIERRFAFQTL